MQDALDKVTKGKHNSFSCFVVYLSHKINKAEIMTFSRGEGVDITCENIERTN